MLEGEIDAEGRKGHLVTYQVVENWEWPLLGDAGDEADAGGTGGVEVEAEAELPVFGGGGLEETGLGVAFGSEDFDGDVNDAYEVAGGSEAADDGGVCPMFR